MAGFSGFLKTMARANSPRLAGWVDGPVARVKGNRMQVLLEDGKVICFLSGSDDIILSKDDVASVELAAQKIEQRYGDKIMVCNSYAVTFKNGEYGRFTIFEGKAAEFLLYMK